MSDLEFYIIGILMCSSIVAAALTVVLIIDAVVVRMQDGSFEKTIIVKTIKHIGRLFK